MNIEEKFEVHINDSQRDLFAFFAGLSKEEQDSLKNQLIVHHRVLEENEDYADILRFVNPAPEGLASKLDQICLCAMLVFPKSEFYHYFYDIPNCYFSHGYNTHFCPVWLKND